MTHPTKSHCAAGTPWMSLEGYARGASCDQGPTEGERAHDHHGLHAREKNNKARDSGSGLGRRAFLKLSAGFCATALVAACERLPVKEAIPVVQANDGMVPGVSVYYASTCGGCSGACGVLASVRDGRPIKLEGNPHHQATKGGLCARGQGEVRALYDSARLKGPEIGGKPAAWGDLLADVGHRLQGDGGLVVLSRALVSPTARKVVEAFAERFGGHLIEYEPVSQGAQAQAYGLLDGAPMARHLRLSRADIVVSFGADLLGTHPCAVSYARDWAERRRDLRGQGATWVQIESSLSLTGAAADARWLSSPAEVVLTALWLLRHVAEGTTHPLSAPIKEALSGLPGVLRAQEVARLCAKLLVARRQAAVETDSDDFGLQLVVALMNRLLGSEGEAVSLVSAPHLRGDGDAALLSLMDRVRGGEVKKVILLACDPVDDLPFGAELARVLPSLGLSLCLSERRTASALVCQAVGATHHFLESWGDARAPDGVTLSLMQPAVMPLFDTRHPLEVLLQLGNLGTDYYAYLRASWRQHVFPSVSGSVRSFDRFWAEALRVGVAPKGADYVVSASALAAKPPVSLPVLVERLALVVAGLSTPQAGLSAELISQPGIMDGARLHVPWLREMPEPLTRVAWVPVARIAPRLAKEKSIANGDVLTLSVQGKEVSLPAYILPGQHPDVVGIPIGFGRADADSQPEHNALRLLSAQQGVLRRTALPVTLSKSAQNMALPLVQVESSSHGRPIIFQVHSEQEHVHGHEPHTPGLWPKRDKPSPQWAMVIDLDRCTGCGACVVACQAENNLPSVGPEEIHRNRDMAWLRIDRYFVGEPDDPQVLFQPMLCSQCANAPCETVCPALATMHSADGLNQQAYNRCVGTRYCANNCPYKVRRFNWFRQDFGPPVERLVLNPDVVVRDRGVMEKCTFCVQRIQSARIDARAQGETKFSPQTACAQSCPAGAIIFGDASDPNGPIAALKKSHRSFRVLAELGVDPSITYLARVRRPSPDPSFSDKG